MIFENRNFLLDHFMSFYGSVKNFYNYMKSKKGRSLNIKVFSILHWNIAPIVSNLSMKQMQNICVNKLTHNNDIMKIPKV